MAKRNFKTKGSFIPRDQKGKHNRIVVDSPALAQFLTGLEAGSSTLTEAITVGEAVGATELGQVFEKGTPLEDVLRAILEGIPTAGISFFQLLDDSLNLLADTPKIAGDEYTVGGIRLIFTDPADQVDVIVYAPGTEATEDLTPPPNQGVTQSIDVVTDYTAGGNASDFAYTFAQGGNASFAKLTPSFTITMKDAEGNTIGQSETTSITWTPPAFMLQLNETGGGLGSWTNMKSTIEGGAWDTSASLFLPWLSNRLNAIYAPIVQHTKSGSYTSSDVNTDDETVGWGYDASYNTVQVGFGDQGVEVPFYGDGTTEYRQVWFFPAGGQVNPSGASFSNITVGGGSYSPEEIATTIDIDIAQTGLGLSTSTTPCLITYRLYASPQTNSIYPVDTATIEFNS